MGSGFESIIFGDVVQRKRKFVIDEPGHLRGE
jgi:hypothetical protein